MRYLIALLCVAFVLVVQYFLSMWLIKIGYFYEYAYAMGGFLLLTFLAAIILMKTFPLLKSKNKKPNNLEEIKQGNHESNAVKLCAILTLLAGFWLNFVKLTPFHEKYEYKTFGIQTKAVVTQKYELQNKGHSYIFILQTQEKEKNKSETELRMQVEADKYTHKSNDFFIFALPSLLLYISENQK